MKKPHFYKVRSRIGLLNPPIYTKIPNIGVEHGSDMILDHQFLNHFPDVKIDSIDFPDPESVAKETYNDMIVQTTLELKQLIQKTLAPDEIQVVLGGDHCITFPSVLAQIDQIGSTKKLGYIQFDSHGDINQYGSSISKNWHGMYVRPLVDTYDIAEIDALSKQKIPVKNILFLGNLFPFLDAEELDFFQKNNIKTFTPKTIREAKQKTIETFKNFINNFDHLHITFDIDALDKTIAPATGLPAAQGLLMEDIEAMLKLATTDRSFSFDLVEVNPEKPGAEKTIQTAQEILSMVLQN